MAIFDDDFDDCLKVEQNRAFCGCFTATFASLGAIVVALFDSMVA